MDFPPPVGNTAQLVGSFVDYAVLCRNGVNAALTGTDLDEVRDFRDHAANRRGIFQLALAGDLVQAEADQRRALRSFAALRALHLLHAECFLGSHLDRLLDLTPLRRCPSRQYGGR